MLSRPLSAALLVRAVLTCALIPAALVAPASAVASTTAVASAACSDTALVEPTTLGAAMDAGVSVATVRAENGLTGTEVEHLAEDGSTWMDECGQLFVVDREVPDRFQGEAAALPGQALPDDVFDLSSLPTSLHTVYLDFDGATVAGTRWQSGAEIVSPAYSIDADGTTFNEAERAQIFLAWQVVAEDFALFDVNVTTRRPDPSALARTSISDQTYGLTAVITPTNSVGSGCGCGGVAYVGVFDIVGTTAYQPAWIFTNGSGTGGYNVGQVVSHEVGHTFGLGHDGTSQASYYSGANGWAPIMGASYNRRASQWSSGEYPDANNTQDDTAVIARSAPVLADDHVNGALGASRLTAGTTATGVIATRTDTDAFTFSADGHTALTVAGPAGLSNLDVRLTILGPLGETVATIDPTGDVAADAAMSATWSVDLPATAATYVAVVDGIGFGTPVEAGRYSDYGSLGGYAVTLSTGGSTDAPPPTTTPPTTTTPTATPALTTRVPSIAFVTTRLPAARAGSAYRATIRFSGPVSEARVDRRLPRGLRWTVVGDRVVIRGMVRRSSAGRFAAVLSGDGGSVRRVFRLVVR